MAIKSYPKEKIEIFDNGKNIIINNFRKIEFLAMGNLDFEKNKIKVITI